MFKLCLQRLGSPVLAEDALQETFMRAFRALPRFDSSRRFFPWLAAIAINVSIDLWQRQSRLSPSGLASSLDEELRHDADVADSVIESQRVRDALARLTPGQRRRLMLHDVAGWQCSDLIDSECPTEPAVRSSLFRARALMRSMLRGLAPAWLTLRRARDRTSLELQRVASPASVEVGSGFLALSLVAILAFPSGSSSEAFGSESATLTTPTTSLMSRRPPQQSGEREMPARSNPTERSSSGAGPVRWSTSFHRVGNDRVAPASGSLGVEIVDQNGNTILFSKTWFKCNDVLDSRPGTPASPIRAAC
ncbi:MAG: RNA polymerase sigma factor [Gammaproteobacteria bacterium]